MLDFTRSPLPYIAGLVLFAFALGLACGWGVSQKAPPPNSTPRTTNG